MKEIIFEEKSTEFSDIKPIIEIRESGIKFQYPKLRKNTNKTNNLRFDRILENLFEKLESIKN